MRQGTGTSDTSHSETGPMVFAPRPEPGGPDAPRRDRPVLVLRGTVISLAAATIAAVACQAAGPDLPGAAEFLPGACVAWIALGMAWFWWLRRRSPVSARRY